MIEYYDPWVIDAEPIRLISDAVEFGNHLVSSSIWDMAMIRTRRFTDGSGTARRWEMPLNYYPVKPA